MIDRHALFFLLLAVILLVASFFISGWSAIGLLVASAGFVITSWLFESRRRRNAS